MNSPALYATTTSDRHALSWEVCSLLCALAAFVLAAPSASAQSGHPSPRMKTSGGPCHYHAYPGVCRVTSVRQIESNQDHGELPYLGYEVQFTFHTEERIEPHHSQLLKIDYHLRLTNSWPPGPRYLKKYGITEGKSFDCRLQVIVKGTCTPILFEFPAIDRSDYFELHESSPIRGGNPHR